MPTAMTDIVAWIVIGLFLIGWSFQGTGQYARSINAVAWALFGGFWLLLIPRFALVMKSPIETVLSALAVPICIYVGYLVWSGRESLFVLSRAVAIMGVVYLPFETIPVLRQTMIEAVARQTLVVIGLLGSEATLTTGPEYGYQSALVFVTDGHRYVTHIVLACTGIGSMSIFAGLIAALEAPLKRKLQAASVAIAVIYVLNLLRNAFIAVAFGEQWFQILTGPVMAITGYQDPGLVSFFIADRVISQSASVVALVGITWLVIRYLPELLTVIEDLLFIVTREEYDLRDRIGRAS
ncbi:MAG: archaeosortase A [Halobacteriales archaeon]